MMYKYNNNKTKQTLIFQNAGGKVKVVAEALRGVQVSQIAFFHFPNFWRDAKLTLFHRRKRQKTLCCLLHQRLSTSTTLTSSKILCNLMFLSLFIILCHKFDEQGVPERS